MESPFTTTQRNQIETFHAFCHETPSAFCASCMIVLYPEEKKYTTVEVSRWNCEDWQLTPIVEEEKGVVVCKACKSTRTMKVIPYPGPMGDATTRLNYRERSMLSPVKLMTQMTRKSTLCTGRIGHYEVKGSIYMRQNYEFPEVAYGGTLGLAFERGSENSSFNMDNVSQAYRALQQTHPLLRRYDLRMEEVVEFHVRENNQHVRVNDHWRHNILMPGEQVNPNAAEVPFNDLPMGSLANKSVSFSHPALMSLVFPWLFPHGKGHFSMINTSVIKEQMKDNNGHEIAEENGGYAHATLYEGFTLGEYAKRLLSHRDRRFAKDPAFLFFLMDAVEQQNIHSSNRLTAKQKPGLRKKDIVNSSSGKFIKNEVTTVPNNIRTSYAYKRMHFLDLKTMCEELGAPQLFMTFTCDDVAEEFKIACGSEQPWEDPVIFAKQYNRKWHQFFSYYIKKRWAPVVGGITDWCYVLEIQDRGSPHMHMVLWTGKTAEELIQDENVVCAKLPPITSTLRPLVEKHQIHKCHVRYCQNNDPTAPCRFHYPKPVVAEPYIEDDHAHYARDVGDEQVNPYCPYLLAMFKSNMDIQVNTGRSALYYLAKYLTKVDKNIEFNLVPHHSHRNNVPLSEHMRSRIVGSIEASYLLLGMHMHSASRTVIFVPTQLPQDGHHRLRRDIRDLNEESTDVFEAGLLEKYEQRAGAPTINLKQFASFYFRETKDKNKWVARSRNMVTRPFYNNPLPEAIVSRGTVYRLYEEKHRFWRTHFVSPTVDSESYYYQQIVLNVPIYRTTFFDFKRDTLQLTEGIEASWKDLFIYLVQHEHLDYQFDVPESMTHELHNIYPDPGQLSLKQQAIYDSINEGIERWNDNCHWVIGSAGTGKSYLLKKFAYYYHSQNYCIVKLAPTGVAAYNIHGETLDRFMGMTNDRKEINKLNLLHHIKLHKHTIFLVDEFSMIPKNVLHDISSALIQTTKRNQLFGGVATIFFGDVGQLLPIQKSQGYVWESPIWKLGNRYHLNQIMRQMDDEAFQLILQKVRKADYDAEVVQFINDRITPKRLIPTGAVRLYTTREYAMHENNKAMEELTNEPEIVFDAEDYPKHNRIACHSLDRETRLVQRLKIKKGITVMIIHNLDVGHGWANGVLAKVIDSDAENIHLQHLGNGQERWIQRITDHVQGTVYSRKQFPMVVSMASTIHKVQSLTLPSVAIFFDDMHSHGQLYVALSRVRTAQDVYFFGIDKDDVKRKFKAWVNCDAIEIINKASLT